jgi:ribosomal protein L24E
MSDYTTQKNIFNKILSEYMSKLPISIICDYLTIYKLRSWIDEKKLIEANPNGKWSKWDLLPWHVRIINYLKTNPSRIDWCFLSENPNNGALDLLEANPDKIRWRFLSRNSNDRAMTLLEENLNKIHWYELSRNPNDRAMTLLEENPDKINWTELSRNTNDRAMTLLEENPDKIDWYGLSHNPNDHDSSRRKPR